jgi:hypothetical protein
MTIPVQPPSLPDTHVVTGHWIPLTRPERKSAIVTALGIFAVLIVAAILTPDERGVGTHQQLGLPPCMTEAVLGVPCPFCGMTTSFSHMAHGQVSQAIIVQPAGALGFVLSAALALGLLAAFATGRAPSIWKAVRRSPWLYLVGGSVIFAAWVYKILAHTGAFSH